MPMAGLTCALQHHVKRDAKFAEALLREGVDAMLSGDVETGKTILRDYIKATVGFEKRPGRVPGTRELVIPRTPFVVPYRLKSDIIQILRVYHGAHRWPKSF